MQPTLQLGTARIALTVLAIILEIALPLGLALLANRRLGVSWRYFGFGALIFAIFQIFTRVPAVLALQAILGLRLAASQTLQWVWLIGLVLTAGLFEEVGRYVGYRWLMGKEQKTWSKGVMYGIGHGGIEAIVLVAGGTALGLANLILLPSVLPSLPQAQQELVRQQLTTVLGQPDWIALVGFYERVWAMAAHVALSLVVLQVFLRHNIRWLWLSIGLHALLNSVTVVSLLGLAPTTVILISEAWVTVFGVGALWLIWRLRGARTESGRAEGAEGAEVVSSV